MPDGALDEPAPVEHLVAERGRLLRGVPSIIGWELGEDPFDLVAQRRELIPGEHGAEEGVAVGLQASH